MGRFNSRADRQALRNEQAQTNFRQNRLATSDARPVSARNPFSESGRDNYQTYPYDYFCIDGDEKIIVYRQKKYEVISIKEFNTKTDKILSRTENGVKIAPAILYQYDFYDYLKSVRANGETHQITDKHRYLNIFNNEINCDGKIPDLGDKISQLDIYTLPNSREHNYINCREICQNIPHFYDNRNGTFTLKGKGTKRNSWYQIPNIVFLDEDLAYIFGLFVAEGHIIDDQNRTNGRGYGVFFSLGLDELSLAHNVCQIIQSKFHIQGSVIEYPQYGRISVRFFNKALSYIFRHIEFGSNCYNKKVPDIIFKTKDHEILKSFIVGCFVGDGTVKDYTLSCKSTSLNLMYGLKILLRLIGLNSNIHLSQKQDKNYQNSYNLCIYSENKRPLVSTFINYDWKHSQELENSLHQRYYSKDKIFNKVSKIELNSYKTRIIYDLHTAEGNYLLGTIWSHNSGADAKVFFGDVFVDDIATIEFNVTQSKTPIYGYASEYYQAVAKGQVLVNGTLTIAFKEVGYLNIIQALIESQRHNTQQALQNVRNKVGSMQLQADKGRLAFQPRLSESYVNFAPNGTAQIIRESETIEGILSSKLVAGNTTFNEAMGLGGNVKPTRDFEDFAELLEDSIWGDSNGNPYTAPRELKRADEFDFNEGTGGIYVPRGHSYANSLNILLTFGDLNDFRAEHTIISINDVHFTSQGLVVTPNGDPIAEMYNFFARTINKSLNTSVTEINPIKYAPGMLDKISTLDDIDKIETQLRNQDNSFEIKIVIMASLPAGGVWKEESGPTINVRHNLNSDISGRQELVEHQQDIVAVSFNTDTPFIDQLITYVEDEFNNIGNDISSQNSQYVVDVQITGNNSTGIPGAIMVLEQIATNTRTYKVISPTRTAFRARNIITRDDIFAVTQDPLLMERDRLNQQHEVNELRRDELNQEILNKWNQASGILETRAQQLERRKAFVDSMNTVSTSDWGTRRSQELENQIESLRHNEIENGNGEGGGLDETDISALTRRQRNEVYSLGREAQQLNENATFYNEMALEERREALTYERLYNNQVQLEQERQDRVQEEERLARDWRVAEAAGVEQTRREEVATVAATAEEIARKAYLEELERVNRESASERLGGRSRTSNWNVPNQIPEGQNYDVMSQSVAGHMPGVTDVSRSTMPSTDIIGGTIPFSSTVVEYLPKTPNRDAGVILRNEAGTFTALHVDPNTNFIPGQQIPAGSRLPLDTNPGMGSTGQHLHLSTRDMNYYEYQEYLKGQAEQNNITYYGDTRRINEQNELTTESAQIEMNKQNLNTQVNWTELMGVNN